MDEKTAYRMLVVLLTLFMGLGAAYALTTPTLEAPDEIYHYDYIRALVKTGRPPVLEEGSGRGFGHHAPLYYAYGALVSFWVGEDDLQAWSKRHNPFFGYHFGEVGRDNKNLYLHPAEDAFGESDTWLGVRVVRLASAMLGAITVWAIYRAGREVFPDRPEIALGAAGLSAFIPEFLFISGAINDDNGAALFGALALWSMVRMLRKGWTRRRCVALGLALGMGWLSKLTIVALLPTAGLALALLAWRDGHWHKLLHYGLITFVVAGLLIGPWLIRQTVLYGDPTGTAREMSEWGMREEPVSLANVGPDLYWLRTSFWGRLGYNQIPLSSWIYTLLDGVTLLSALGLIRLLVTRLTSSTEPWRSQLSHLLSTARGSQFAVLTSSVLLVLGPMVVRRFLRPMPNFGRYLFPVLPSIALLMTTGLSTWVSRNLEAYLAVFVTLAMLALGVSGLVCFLRPAYASPQILDDAEKLAPTHRVDHTYLENGKPLARMIGYDLDQEVVKPQETLGVKLYWEVLGQTDSEYTLFVQVFGREGAKVGQRDTYPGLGHYPTSFWEEGQRIVDTVPVPIASDAAAPSRLRLDVGLYQRGNGRLSVVDGKNSKIDDATIGWLKLASPTDPAPPTVRTDYRLGEVARLIGYDLERLPGQIRLKLHWSCQAPTEEDYVVFVHMLDEDGDLLVQADGPPVGGDYPTSLWEAGETIVDRHVLQVTNAPPGSYALQVGLYLLDTGERLTVRNAAGVRLPHDTIPLAEVNLP